MRLVPVYNHQIDATNHHILTHNFNATDALHLQCALEIHSRLQPQGDRLLFCSADQRLLRAAQTEGLATFNPETGMRQLNWITCLPHHDQTEHPPHRH
jgi:hypothetical protein